MRGKEKKKREEGEEGGLDDNTATGVEQKTH